MPELIQTAGVAIVCIILAFVAGRYVGWSSGWGQGWEDSERLNKAKERGLRPGEKINVGKIR